MNRTVLCVVEFDNYPEQVVARAAWLSKRHDCDLELLLSEPITSYLGETFVYFAEMQMLADSVRHEQDAALRQLADSAAEIGVNVTSSTSHERPEADVIAAKAKAIDAAFVVKGTHYHSPSERASLADTDWTLIRNLECALWFVKPFDWKEPAVVVAAVDPTYSGETRANLDQKIVETAKDIVSKSGGDLLLLHTYERLEEIGSRVTWKFKPEKLPIDKLDEKIRDEHRRALLALATECGVAQGAVHQLPGRAHDILPAFARSNKASLVVMGALARSGLKKRIVGSTAARVLDHLPCDVLVVHS